MTEILKWVEQQRQKQEASRHVAGVPSPKQQQEATRPDLVEQAHWIQESNQEHHAQRRAFAQELVQQLPDGIKEERRAAQQALHEAQGLVQQSARKLAQHEAGTPQASQVPAWARQRAELQGELEAYQRLEEQAGARVHHVEQRTRHALQGIWEAMHARAMGNYEQMVKEDKAALIEAQEMYNRLFSEIGEKEERQRQLITRIKAMQP